MNDVLALRQQGIPTGICGNFMMLFKVFPEWWKYFSFYGPSDFMTRSLVEPHARKHMQLMEVAKLMPAKRYVMVGNALHNPKAAPGSQDDIQASLAKWEFISELDFSRGVR